MPASIDAVLAGRLGRLAAGERATLQRAAVVGRVFSRGAVAALAPPDLAVDAHLLALTRRGFVRAVRDPLPGDDAYSFHHVLLRDTAYATLTKNQRARPAREGRCLARPRRPRRRRPGRLPPRAGGPRPRGVGLGRRDEIAARPLPRVSDSERRGSCVGQRSTPSRPRGSSSVPSLCFPPTSDGGVADARVRPDASLGGRHSRAEKVLAAAVEPGRRHRRRLAPSGIERAQATFEADPSTGESP